jgi:O-antigen ligase
MTAFTVAVIFTSGICFARFSWKNDKWNIGLLVIFMFALITSFFSFVVDLLPGLDDINRFLLGSMGKSETLTGRTELWELVLSQSQYHDPLFGGGYGGFWNGPNSVAAYTASRNGIYLGQAHNGYIDIYNDLGWVGLALTLSIILSLVSNIYRIMKRERSEWKLCLSILIVILVSNYAESTLMRTTQFLNVLFISVVVFSQRLLYIDQKSSLSK